MVVHVGQGVDIFNNLYRHRAAASLAVTRNITEDLLIRCSRILDEKQNHRDCSGSFLSFFKVLIQEPPNINVLGPGRSGKKSPTKRLPHQGITTSNGPPASFAAGFPKINISRLVLQRRSHAPAPTSAEALITTGGRLVRN